MPKLENLALSRIGRIFLLFLGFFIALFSDLTNAAPTDPPIRIGVSLGLTGAYQDIGRLQRLTYELWEKQINARGGILGRKVELIIRDDRSEPDTAKSIYEQFVQIEKLDFVFGPYSSPITLAIAPIVDKYGYPMLVAGASSDKIWEQGYKNIFGVFSPASRFPIGFLAILSEAGIKSIAIVSKDDAFSRDVSESAKKWAAHYGLRVTLFLLEPSKNPNLAGAAEAARKSGTQALLLAGHFNEAVEMRKELKRMGWSPAAYYASVGPALQQYSHTLGDDANGTLSTSLWEPREDLRFPNSATFLKEFVAAYGEMPSYHCAQAYAAGQILEKAIVQAGTIDRSAIRKVLFSLDTNTIAGRYSVDQTGLQVKRFPLIIQWQNNKREIVWPAEMRTAPAIIHRAP